MMLDRNFDRDYQLARTSMNLGIADGFSRLVRSAAISLAVLNRKQFSAPWKQAKCS